MKYAKLFVCAIAALAITACSGSKTEKSEETATETTAEPTAKVVELTDPSTIAPGVKVDRLTVVDFNAVWCGPCRMLAPVLEQMAEKYDGKVDFISVDVDKYGELFEAYKLGSSIPVVLFLSPDGSTSHYVGIADLMPADKFEAIIESKLAE